MKEEDNIANIVNNTEIKSFDIKQEWIDDISTKLDAYNSKRKQLVYWYALAAILLITSFFILFYTSKNTINNPTYTDSNTKTNQTKGKSITPSNNQHKVPNTTIQNKTSKLKTPTIQHKTITNSSTQALNRITKTKGELANSLKKQKKNTTEETQQKSIVKKDLQIPIQHPVVTTLITNQNDHIESDIQDSQNHLNENNTSRNNSKNTESKHSQDLGENNFDDHLTKSENNESTNESHTIKQLENNQTSFIGPKDSIKTIDTLITSSSISLDTTIVQATLIDSLKDTDKEQDTTIDYKKPRAKNWAIGFAIGPDRLDKQLTSTADFQNFDQKKTEELFSNTWGFDFEINRNLNNWLSLSSGLGLKEYKETNSYSSSSYNTYDTVTNFFNNSYYIYDSIYNQVDTTWIIIDSTWVIDTSTTTTIKTYTKIDSSKKAANGEITSQYIQIPISCQLTFIRTEKLRAYTNLGISFGVLTKNTGVTLGFENNTIANYTTRKLILSSTIGVGVNYNFFGPFDYKVYAAYRGNLSNFSLRPDIKKKYNGFVFRTGLIYKF